MDLRKYPAKMAVLTEVRKKMRGNPATGESEDQGSSDAAQEAITEDMTAAMEGYAPLRNMISFTGGQANHEDLKQIIDAMNAAE